MSVSSSCGVSCISLNNNKCEIQVESKGPNACTSEASAYLEALVTTGQCTNGVNVVYYTVH